MEKLLGETLYRALIVLGLSPDARKRNVIASFVAAGMAFRKFVSAVLMAGVTYTTYINS